MTEIEEANRSIEMAQLCMQGKRWWTNPATGNRFPLFPQVHCTEEALKKIEMQLIVGSHHA